VGALRESRAAAPLSAAQKDRVQRAINAIKNGPPATITFRDSTGNVDTLSTTAIAKSLQKQLDDGRIKVDSTISADDYAVATTDGRASDAADEVDVHPEVVSGADSTFLQEVLVHEWRHKVQVNGSEAADEVEAYSLELSYKDSLGLDSTNFHYRECRNNLASFQGNVDDAARPRERKRSALVDAAGRYWQLLLADPGQGVVSRLQTRPPGSQGWTLLPPLLGGTVNGSDLLKLDTPSQSTLLACGTTQFGAGALVALQVSPTGTVMEQLILLRFGESFHCMTLLPEPGSVAVLDVVQNRVRRFFDSNGDGIPDADGGTMILLPPSGSWRRLDQAQHPLFGAGLVAGQQDRLFSHLRRLHEPLTFMQDVDGDHLIDLIHLVPAYHFIQRVPVIQEPYPQPGDNLLLVSGSWNHHLEVWRTDPLGNPMHPLGMVHMMEPEMPVILDMPLELGEWIRPFDLNTGQWQGRAIRVGGEPEPLPAPGNLAIQLEAMPMGWTFLLTWDPVPGALYYRIESNPGTGEWLPFADVLGTSHAWTLPGPTLPALHLFRVRACN
jgi:hypothetical protein